MRQVIEQKLLPFVIKPGRYVGGELGQINKAWENRTSYLHAFPDKYEIGQAHLGSEIIYHIVNRDDRFVCERAFGVDRDAEEVMRREGIELFSLESCRPAKDFDAIGISLTFELVYTTVLSMLDLADIPLRALDRDDSDPIIMAGGPSAFNPEPLSAFIDLFFIGDAEEGIIDLLTVLHETKGQPRRDRLEAIVRRVPSAYVPQFYDENAQPTVDFAPAEIVARIASELRAESYPEQPLLPLIDTVHNHLAVEIMRGCPQGCRFCQASATYKPVRIRRQEDVLRQIDRQTHNTGYGEVSLMSLSTSDYPNIEQLALTAARRLKNQRVSLSLPSLRPGSISPELLDAVSMVRHGGLTLAPEAGTERLRSFVRKDFTDEAILDTARIAFDKGWTNLKLYFMIGLPTETDDDLAGIGRLATEIYNIGRDYPGKKTVTVSLSPFNPKPHTPFGWDEMLSREEINRRIGLVKKLTRARQVVFKSTRWETSFLAFVLGRGGRELSDVIEAAYRRGCRYDGWTEDFRWESWLEAFEETGFDKESAARPIAFDASLPWSHIRKGPSLEQLQAERMRTSLKLREYVPKYKGRSMSEVDRGPTAVFGRAKKKVASRNLAAPTKNCVRIRWGKTARCRYMSHLDNIRALERAIRRAKLPVAYSQGFNPTMKLSFGPPLSLGFTSESEFVDITLDTNLEAFMIDNLKKAMPDGMHIIDARVVFGKPQSLSAALNRVVYSLDLDNLPHLADLEDRVRRLLAAGQLRVSRTTKTKTEEIDIRPGVFDARVEERQLLFELGLGQQHYVRPTEVALILLDGDERTVATLPFHRREMYAIDENGVRRGGIDL